MFSALLLSAALASDSSAGVRGQYVEARTCDVYTGECFANADTGLTGKNAVLAWRVDSGTVGGVKLNGLGVIAVLSTSDTLGLKQSAPGRSLIIVDEKATTAQRDALVAFAKAQAGKLLGEVVAVRAASFDLEICKCDGETCATLKAGAVKVDENDSRRPRLVLNGAEVEEKVAEIKIFVKHSSAVKRRCDACYFGDNSLRCLSKRFGLEGMP